MSSLRSCRAVLGLLTAALAVLALGASAASAAETISVTFGGDPTEEVPLPITATWTSALTGPRVYVTVKPAGGQTCAPSYAADDPNSSDVIAQVGSGPSLSLSENRTFADPGTFILCGYLQTSSDATSPLTVTGPVTMTVRAAHATVTVSAPPRVDPGQRFALSLPITAELRRNVWVTSKPAGGRGCAATYALDEPQSTDLITGAAVQGTQTVQETVSASQTQGTYLLCAYVQEGSSDPSPEATASTTFLVGPDPCVSARDALRGAQRSVRVAETSVNANRASWRRYSAAARRTRGAARRRNRAYARRARSRYQSAVRRRATARGTLATSQDAVTQACGPAPSAIAGAR